MSDNPFDILQLDPGASEEEIVQRASVLRQRASSEEEVDRLRRAVHQLTASPEVRQRYALQTHPCPQYHWPALERLAEAYRRPVQLPAIDSPAPIEADSVTSLLRQVLAEHLPLSPMPFDLPALEEPESEILRQTVEALWLQLPFEPPKLIASRE